MSHTAIHSKRTKIRLPHIVLAAYAIGAATTAKHSRDKVCSFKLSYTRLT